MMCLSNKHIIDDLGHWEVFIYNIFRDKMYFKKGEIRVTDAKTPKKKRLSGQNDAYTM